MDWIVSLLAIRCAFCGRARAEARAACVDCSRQLTLLEEEAPVRLELGAETRGLEQRNIPNPASPSSRPLHVVSAFEYLAFGKELILGAKSAPSKPVVRWLADCLAVKTPLEWRALPLLWLPGRSFGDVHLVEALAWELRRRRFSLIEKLPLERKLRRTREQKELGEAERRGRDMSEVYGIRRRARLAPKPVVLLDDVVTTGSTLLGCKRLVEERLGLEVRGALTLAATPRIFCGERDTRRSAAGPC